MYRCIPKYSKYFNSFKVPELPELPFRELVCSDVMEQIKQNENQELNC